MTPAEYAQTPIGRRVAESMARPTPAVETTFCPACGEAIVNGRHNLGRCAVPAPAHVPPVIPTRTAEHDYPGATFTACYSCGFGMATASTPERRTSLYRLASASVAGVETGDTIYLHSDCADLASAQDVALSPVPAPATTWIVYDAESGATVAHYASAEHATRHAVEINRPAGGVRYGVDQHSPGDADGPIRYVCSF